MTKKEKIDATARDLFWKHGFKKVSIDEICKKSGVSRKTFYTYYANKIALVLSILENLTNDMFLSYEKLVHDETKSFSEKLSEMLLQKYEANKQFSMEFVNDFYHPDSAEILDFFMKVSGKSISLTREFFIQAQAQGAMNPNLDINFVMWYIQKQVDVAKSPEIQSMFASAKDMSRQFSELIIFGIMPVDKPEL